MYSPRYKAPPPGILESMVDATFGSWIAVQQACLDYWTRVLLGEVNPFNATLGTLNWWGAVLQQEHPEWASPNTVIREWPIARLRDFSAPDAAPDSAATLILPPHAGHDSCIVDYAETQSQVRAARDNGMDRVYSMDWTPATEATKDATIDDYIDVLLDAVVELGGQVNLVGDCQGGWLAAIFSALYPDMVRSLAIAGAPVDFHAGQPLLHDWVQFVTPGDDLRPYQRVVKANDGVVPGSLLQGGFLVMQGHKDLQRQLGLLAGISDPAHAERFALFQRWFQWTQPMPGAFYLWVVEYLFQKNELIRGVLIVKGRRVRLADISCPLFLLAAEGDHVTPPEQVWALTDLVSTPPKDIHHFSVNGGHLGLLMGREALEEHWPLVFRAMSGVDDVQEAVPEATPAAEAVPVVNAPLVAESESELVAEAAPAPEPVAATPAAAEAAVAQAAPLAVAAPAAAAKAPASPRSRARKTVTPRQTTTRRVTKATPAKTAEPTGTTSTPAKSAPAKSAPAKRTPAKRTPPSV